MYNKVMFIEAEMESWIGPIICYMENGDLLMDKTKATKCIKFVVRYTVITNKLYKRGFITPFLRCLIPQQAKEEKKEVHEEVCRSQIGRWSFGNKVIMVGYYWLTMQVDCMKHANLYRALSEWLNSLSSPWPFNQWSIDILNPFPLDVQYRWNSSF